MEHIELTVLGLLVAVSALSAAARMLGVPYPILLVVGGSALGFVPGLPSVELDPDLVLLIFLPPLLFNAASMTSLRDLRANLRPIVLAALALVLMTTCAVAIAVHAAVDGLPWAAAFALGAIVSPTDPLAATAIAGRLGVPRRITSVIEGESLVNDGTALVAYRTAVAAAVGGGFDLLDASVDFVVDVAGGIVIGLIAAEILTRVFRRIVDDPVLTVTIALTAGYIGYLPAEQLHVSGVLAAVTVGLVVGRRSHALTSAADRLSGYAFWEILVFLLNAVLFILVGFQLNDIISAQERGGGELVGLVLLTSGAVIGMRLLFLNTIPYLIRALDRRPSQVARRVGWRPRMVVAWSGLRGAVSLAAALALPLDFPERDLLLLLTFGVIFSTLVLQGLSLPWLIRRLGVRDDGELAVEELRARRAAVEAAIGRLDELAEADWTRNDTVERIAGMYRFRRRRLAQRDGEGPPDGDEEDLDARSLTYQRTVHEVIAAQRRAVIALRDDGAISDEVMHLLERELDLEEARLEI